MVTVTRWLLPLAVVGGAAANVEVQMSLCISALAAPRIGVADHMGIVCNFLWNGCVHGLHQCAFPQHEEASSVFTPLL